MTSFGEAPAVREGEDNAIPFDAPPASFPTAEFGADLYPPLPVMLLPPEGDWDGDGTFLTTDGISSTVVNPGGSSTADFGNSATSMGNISAANFRGNKHNNGSAGPALGISTSMQTNSSTESRRQSSNVAQPKGFEVTTLEEEDQRFRDWNGDFQRVSEIQSAELRAAKGEALIKAFETEVAKHAPAVVERWARPAVPLGKRKADDAAHPRWLPAPPTQPSQSPKPSRAPTITMATGNSRTVSPAPQPDKATNEVQGPVIDPVEGFTNRFLFRGVHFHVMSTPDYAEYYGSFENAHKVVDAEVRMLRRLWWDNPTQGTDPVTGLTNPIICVPLATSLLVHGVCVFAVAPMPVDQASQLGGPVYGRGEYLVLTDRRAYMLLQRIASKYNFPGYFVNEAHMTSELATHENLSPLDAIIHRSAEDGRMYLYNVAKFAAAIDVSRYVLLHDLSSGKTDCPELNVSSDGSPLVFDQTGNRFKSPPAEESTALSTSKTPATNVKVPQNRISNRNVGSVHFRRLPVAALGSLPLQLVPNAKSLLPRVSSVEDDVKTTAFTDALLARSVNDFLHGIDCLELGPSDGPEHQNSTFTGSRLKSMMHMAGLPLHMLGVVLRRLLTPPQTERDQELQNPEMATAFHPPQPPEPKQRHRKGEPRMMGVSTTLYSSAGVGGSPTTRPTGQMITVDSSAVDRQHIERSPPNSDRPLVSPTSPRLVPGAPIGGARRSSVNVQGDQPMTVIPPASIANNNSIAPPGNVAPRSPLRPGEFTSSAASPMGLGASDGTSLANTKTRLSRGSLMSPNPNMEPVELPACAAAVAIHVVRIEMVARSFRAILREHWRALVTVDGAKSALAGPVPDKYKPPAKKSVLLDHLREKLSSGSSSSRGAGRPQFRRATLGLAHLNNAGENPSTAEKLRRELRDLDVFGNMRHERDERRCNVGETTRQLAIVEAAESAELTGASRTKLAEPEYTRDAPVKTVDDEAREITARLLSLLFGDGPGSERFWSSTLMAELWGRYGNAGSVIELRNVDMEALFRRVTFLCGIEARWPRNAGRAGQSRVGLGATFEVAAVRSLRSDCKGLLPDDQLRQSTAIQNPPRYPKLEEHASAETTRVLLARLQTLEERHTASTMRDISFNVAQNFIEAFEALCRHFGYMGKSRACDLALFRLRLDQMTQYITLREVRELWDWFAADGIVFVPCPLCRVPINLSASSKFHTCRELRQPRVTAPGIGNGEVHEAPSSNLESPSPGNLQLGQTTNLQASAANLNITSGTASPMYATAGSVAVPKSPAVPRSPLAQNLGAASTFNATRNRSFTSALTAGSGPELGNSTINLGTSHNLAASVMVETMRQLDASITESEAESMMRAMGTQKKVANTTVEPPRRPRDDGSFVDRGLYSIGLGTGRFPNSNLTASSTAPGFSPHYARLNMPVGGWAPEDGREGPEYLQFTLRAPRVIGALELQGIPGANRALPHFELQYLPPGGGDGEDCWKTYTSNYYLHDHQAEEEANGKVKELQGELSNRRRARESHVAAGELSEREAIMLLGDPEDLKYRRELVVQTPRRKELQHRYRKPYIADYYYTRGWVPGEGVVQITPLVQQEQIATQMVANNGVLPDMEDSSIRHRHPPSGKSGAFSPRDRGMQGAPSRTQLNHPPSDVHSPWEIPAESVNYNEFVRYGVMRGPKTPESRVTIELCDSIMCRKIRIVPSGADLSGKVGCRAEFFSFAQPSSVIASTHVPRTERVPMHAVEWSSSPTSNRVSRNRTRMEFVQQELRIMKELRDMEERMLVGADGEQDATPRNLAPPPGAGATRHAMSTGAGISYNGETRSRARRSRPSLCGGDLLDKIERTTVDQLCLSKTSQRYMDKLSEWMHLLREWGAEREGDLGAIIARTLQYRALEIEFFHSRDRDVSSKAKELANMVKTNVRTFGRHRAAEFETVLRRTFEVLKEAGGHHRLLRPAAEAAINWFGPSSTALPFFVELLLATCATAEEEEAAVELCCGGMSTQVLSALRGASEALEITPRAAEAIRFPPPAAPSLDKAAASPRDRNVATIERVLRLEKLHQTLADAKAKRDLVCMDRSPRDTFKGVLIGEFTSDEGNVLPKVEPVPTPTA